MIDSSEEESRLFSEFYKKLSVSPASSVTDTYNIIPKFYSPLPPKENILLTKLRKQARDLSIDRKFESQLDNDELQNLYNLLDKHPSPPCKSASFYGKQINFEDFLKVRDLAGPKCARFFTASVFAKLLQNDVYGRISVSNFFAYVRQKFWMEQTRLGLCMYDYTGHGYLKEDDFETYILDVLPTLPQIASLDSYIHSFYSCAVVRKFFFFLDPMRLGHIRIQDIFASGFLEDILELRDENVSWDAQKSNWFSAQSFLHVYGHYANLDADNDGMLSKEELQRYGSGALTTAFVNRLFEEYKVYDGKMDFKTYLDFVLALENLREPQSLRYFVRILDLEGKGYLTSFSLNYFYRDILEKMKENNQELIPFDDVKDGIFDIVKPADPCKITLQDLIACGQGDTVVKILIDWNSFWAYETRDMMPSFASDETTV